MPDSIPKIYEQTFTIRHSEADRFGKLKIRPLFDFAQEVAGNHAALFGMDTPLLRTQKRTWVVSRIKYKITEYPEGGETIKVVTYPRDFDHMFARRQYNFFRENGTQFAEATSYWLIVSLETGRIVVPDQDILSRLPNNKSLPLSFDSLGKIVIPSNNDWQEVDTYNIRENMVDINCHLNNAECGAFIQNYLGPGKYPAELQVNYSISVPPETRLIIKGSPDVPEDEFKLAAMLDGHQAIQIAGTLLK